MEYPDPAAMRRQYRAQGLSEADLADDPVQQFERWFVQAASSGLDEPNAMVLSTADGHGRPSSRTVLLKGYDERGFVFFTNYGSRKGDEITQNPRVSLLFPWHPIARQVLICGEAVRTTVEETERYFRSRPRGSQLGAWTSRQSQVVASREELEQRYADLERRHPVGTPVPVPPFWGGFLVVPHTVEFWQGRENRLHDRLRFRRADDHARGWLVERLAP